MSLKVSIYKYGRDNRQCSSVTAERLRIECAPGRNINIVEFYLEAPTEASLTFVLSISPAGRSGDLLEIF